MQADAEVMAEEVVQQVIQQAVAGTANRGSAAPAAPACTTDSSSVFACTRYPVSCYQLQA